MGNEAGDKPQSTLEEVALIARTTALRDGFHRPMMIVEGDHQNVSVPLERLGTTYDARAQQLFTLGAILAEEGEIGVLQQVFLITEAWLSVNASPNLPNVRPSLDPNRKEVLTVAQWSVQPPKTEIVIFEMKRNKKGKLIQLEDQHMNEQNSSMESPLLQAFAVGYLGSALRSSETLYARKRTPRLFFLH